MTIFAVVSLSLVTLVCLYVAVSAFLVAGRVRALGRLAKMLRDHPLFASLERINAIQAKLIAVPEGMAIARERSLRIALNMSRIAAAGGLFGRDVARVTWATRLLLATFVPAMRGFIAD